METLDYARPPTATELARPWVLIGLAGLTPLAVLIAATMHWVFTGDPVAGLAVYKGYHYLSVAILISLVGWFALVCWRAPRRTRVLFCLIALCWVCLNAYLVQLFIRGVRADDPSGYYQSLWDAQ